MGRVLDRCSLCQGEADRYSWVEFIFSMFFKEKTRQWRLCARLGFRLFAVHRKE